MFHKSNSVLKTGGRGKGFTLIELLVVIAIIGVLASIVLASLNSARRKSRDARRIADIKQIQLALELYFDAFRRYPDTLALLAPDYIPSVPADPLGGAYPYDNYLTNLRPSGCITPASCVYYHLGALLEEVTNSALLSDRDFDGVVDAGPDGVSNLAACGSAGTALVDDRCYDVVP